MKTSKKATVKPKDAYKVLQYMIENAVYTGKLTKSTLSIPLSDLDPGSTDGDINLVIKIETSWDSSEDYYEDIEQQGEGDDGGEFSDSNKEH